MAKELKDAYRPCAVLQSPLLRQLVASKAITAQQASLLNRLWPNLDADAFAHPYLRTVPEHTRAHLERGC